MKQVLQDLKSGRFGIVEVPCPSVRPGHLLVETKASLISSGTERMLIKFGQAGWVERIRTQPDRVKQVADKVRAEGVVSAWQAVQSKLEREIPLGYANAGRVLAVGAGVFGWRVGDRVVSNGCHAEVVAVPSQLAVRIPDAVTDNQAAFAVLAAIGLQGIRLATPSLGESFAVFGLGLVGLLVAQMLRSSGCRVLGVDPDPVKRNLASRWGVHSLPPESADSALAWTDGRGVDGVIIATATDSQLPLRQAASMCRRKGRIILTGVAGLHISRDLFYKKELSFQVSCSYGPGRYDDSYEKQGRDYPFGDVRWTAQRNIEAALEAMRDQRLDVAPLISHRFPFERADEAYRQLLAPEPSLGILLEYASGPRLDPFVSVRPALISSPSEGAGSLSVSLIGAGEFASRVLLPELRGARIRRSTIVTEGGVTAASAARRFGFQRAATDPALAFEAESERHAVVIGTRHDSHACLAISALDAGHAVWVEKPLAISASELRQLIKACERSRDRGAEPCLMVGFNRRFAPLVTTLKSRLARVGGAMEFRYLINAGHLDASSWILDPAVGGGRVVSECCHFIDLVRFLAGQPITRLQAIRSGSQGARLLIEMGSAATASIDYLTGGSRLFPKERLDVFAGGKVWVLDNFQSLREYPGSFFSMMRLDPLSRFMPPRKGHRQALREFVSAASMGRPAPIPLDEILEVTDWTLEAARQIA